MEHKRFDNLWQYVEHWAEIDPDLASIRFENRSYTWGEFNRLTDNFAASLLELGVKKGDIIATMLPSSPEYMFSLIAADKIGAIVCALDVKYRTADLKKFISHLKPRVLISLSQQEDYNIVETLLNVEKELNTAGSIQYLTVGDSKIGLPFSKQLEKNPFNTANLEKAKMDQDREDSMLIVFTGGTTGVPKAALLSKHNVEGMARIETDFLIRNIENHDPSTRLKTIVSLPPSHVGGTVEMMGTGIVGGMEMFVQDTWSPNRVMETVQEEKIQWIGGVPTMFAIMLVTPELEQYDLSSLKLAILSGEKTELELLQAIHDHICPNLIIGYGSTESGSEVTFTEPGEDFSRIADGFVGYPLPGLDIKIVGDDEMERPCGEKGEVLVKGDFTIRSYFNMPEEDKAGFTPSGYCKTGDLGYLTPEGGLFIKGRKKHIIRVGSYTVMPTEIEEVVSRDPSIGMCAAIGAPDKILGEVVWLVVSPVPGADVDSDALISLCEEQLAKFKVPKRIIVKNDLPLTRIGKVHRVELQNEILEQEKENMHE